MGKATRAMRMDEARALAWSEANRLASAIEVEDGLASFDAHIREINEHGKQRLGPD